MPLQQQRSRRQKYLAGLLLACVCVRAWSEVRFQPEDLRLMALAPEAGQAVLQTPDRQFHTVSIGAVLPGTAVMLRKVLPAMLVLEEAGGTDAGPQILWMARTTGAQTPPLRRFSKSTPALPLQAPARVITVPLATLPPETRTGNP